MKPQKPLTTKQKSFVFEYLKDKNGTQAAIRAGYSKSTANEQAARLLANVSIKAAIDAELQKIAEEAKVTAHYVINNLKEVVSRCMQHQPVMVYDRDAREMVQATEIVKDADGNAKEVGVFTFDAMGANKALELLGKHLKLFTDKIQVDDNESLAKMMEAGEQRLKEHSASGGKPKA